MIDSINELLENVISIDYDSMLKNPENENMLNLAYVGDVVYDLYVSDRLIRSYNGKKKINDINKLAQSFLCAKGQARFVEKLIDDGILTDYEIDIFKHGRNAHSNTKSKNSNIVDYRKATGFESLIGYLFYKKDIKRIIDILSYLSV